MPRAVALEPAAARSAEASIAFCVSAKSASVQPVPGEHLLEEAEGVGRVSIQSLQANEAEGARRVEVVIGDVRIIGGLQLSADGAKPPRERRRIRRAVRTGRSRWRQFDAPSSPTGSIWDRPCTKRCSARTGLSGLDRTRRSSPFGRCAAEALCDGPVPRPPAPRRPPAVRGPPFDSGPASTFRSRPECPPM